NLIRPRRTRRHHDLVIWLERRRTDRDMHFEAAERQKLRTRLNITRPTRVMSDPSSTRVHIHRGGHVLAGAFIPRLLAGTGDADRVRHAGLGHTPAHPEGCSEHGHVYASIT